MLVISALIASLASIWLTPVAATNQPTCSNSTLSNFKIEARYTDPSLNWSWGVPTGGIPITGTLVDVNSLTFYSLLTNCPTCWSPWDTFKLTNGALQPQNPNLGWATESLHVNPGSSPSFETSSYPTAGPNEWCAMPTDTDTEPTGQTLPPLQLAVQNTPGLFYLCNNATANGRRDLVFQFGATYAPQLSNCNKVTLFPIPV